MELTKEDIAAIKYATFVVETVAHLKAQEAELLPVADHLRQLVKRWEVSQHEA